ncbi:hypothetical protein GCM10018785_73130 [Streptomyces longispororuber]|uniref:Uncharacterized protein n=1 Tax=Streptomyces longispororuber TaxID=68230 RepID=A0A919AD38_9ACTN|nr:hypothetical protein GCM10018785_73130 [Streptomyces longispororuber]
MIGTGPRAATRPAHDRDPDPAGDGRVPTQPGGAAPPGPGIALTGCGTGACNGARAAWLGPESSGQAPDRASTFTKGHDLAYTRHVAVRRRRPRALVAARLT